METIGIGDLHLDGPLIRHVPDLNERIADEVRRVFDYARHHGVRNVVFYGDIFHRPNASIEGQKVFLNLLMTASDLSIYVIAGNHDKESTQGSLATQHSLAMFESMQEFNMLPHVRLVVHEPLNVRIEGEVVRFLPWPHASVHPKAVNVIHVEAHGAALDNGRKLENKDGEAHRLLDTGAQCVAGHLHTPQRVRNIHYSGTLYQTTFGESLPKFFHHCTVTRGVLSVEKVPHAPGFVLHNIIVKEQADLDSIPSPYATDPDQRDRPQPRITDFCKLFIHKDVAMPVDLLERFPNIIRHNTYRTTKELEVLVQEELRLDGVDLDLNERSWVRDWLKLADAEAGIKRRAYALYNDLRRAPA